MGFTMHKIAGKHWFSRSCKMVFPGLGGQTPPSVRLTKPPPSAIRQGEASCWLGGGK